MSPSDSWSGPEACSIFCRDGDLSLLMKAMDGYVVERDGRSSEGTLRALCGMHEIYVNPLPWTTPDEALARAILGALTFVRRIPTVHQDRKRAILATLIECRLLVGVTGSLGFLSDQECLGVIRGLAAETTGVIFDGADFYDAEGTLLLSHDGRIEIDHSGSSGNPGGTARPRRQGD